MRVIAVANQKGGCGKTTSAINLTASLAFLHKKVLLIDLDPQGHSTCGLGIKAEALAKTAYDLFHRNGHQATIAEVVISVEQDFDLIPSHVVLSAAEREMAGEPHPDQRLIEHLDQIHQNYDFIIIDCPPNLGILTFNALRACDEIMIPIEPSFFSLHGLAKMFETIEQVKTICHKTFRVHALLTRFEKRTKLTREIEEEVKRYFQDQLLTSYIRENVRLKEAVAAGKSIVRFDRNSTGFQDYMSLAIELIERGMFKEARTLEEVNTNDVMSQTSKSEPVLGASLAQPEEKGVESDNHVSSVVMTEEESTEQEAKTLQIEPPQTLTPQVVLGGILFSYSDPHVKEVLVAGDFNRWIAEPLVRVEAASNLWRKVITIEPGTYRYKFLVDGEWKMDPANEVAEPTAYGGSNSVIEVY